MRLKFKLNKYLIASLLLVLSAVVGLPKLIDFNKYKEIIILDIKQKMKTEVQIKGNVKFQFSPLPTLIISNVEMASKDGKKITVERIKVNPDLLQLLMFKFDPQKIILENATIEILNLGDYVSSANRISSLELVNSTIILPGAEIFKEITNINALLYHNDGVKRLNLESRFKIFQQDYFLNTKLDNIDSSGNTKNASFTLGNSNASVKFNGSLKDLFQKPDLDGNLALKVASTTTSKTDDKFLNFILDDKLQAEGKFKFNKQLLSITEIKVDSSSIKKGTGDINVIFNTPNEFDINFNIQQLNADEIIKNAKYSFSEETNFEENLKVLLESFDFQIPKTIDGNSNLVIEEIQYNGDSARNLKFGLNYFDGEIILEELAFNLPKHSSFKISGFIGHNDVRPKFDGSASINLKDAEFFSKWLGLSNLPAQIITAKEISLNSQVSVIPRTLRLNSFDLFYDGKGLSGKFMIKNTGENKLYSKITLKINELDFNELGVSSSVDDIIFKLYLYDQDKSGQYFVNAVDDYAWLRRFPVTLYLDLATNNILYKNLQFNKSNFLIKIFPNNIEIDKFEVESNYLSFNAKGKIKINIMTPEIHLALDLKKLYYPVVGLLLPSLDSLKQTKQDLYKKLSEKKIKINLPEFVPDIDINFFSMQNFNSDFKFNIKDLIIDNDNAWSDIKIKGAIQDGVLNLDNLNGNIFGGQLTLYGNTVFVTQFPSFKYSFSLDNIAPEKLFSFCCGYNSMSGYMSVVGNFTTDGYNAKSFYSRMYADLNFIAKKLTFDGFDVGAIISATEADDLLLPVKLERLKNAAIAGKSVFDDVKGKGSIKEGVMVFNNISFSNNRVQGNFSFGYNMQQNLINGVSRFSFVPAGAFAGLTVDIHNKGNLATQDFTMDSTKVSDYLNLKSDKTQVKSPFKH